MAVKKTQKSSRAKTKAKTKTKVKAKVKTKTKAKVTKVKKTSVGTKKRTAKKASPKKRAVKKRAEVLKKTTTQKSRRTRKASKSLVVAVGDGCFWVNEGPVLRDLVELGDTLSAMHKWQFDFHANKDRNDFASWVESVLHDPICAKAIKKAKTPKAASKAVKKALQRYRL